MYVVLIIFLAALYCIALKKTKGRQPPLLHDGAWPIVGHTFSIMTNPVDLHKLVLKMSRNGLKQGATVKILRIGILEVYGVVDPESAHQVLNSCLQKDLFYDYFKPWIGEGLLTATETIWKVHRRLLNPTFNQEVLDSYLSEFNTQARLLVNQLDDKAGSGRFDPAPYLEHSTLQTICSTAMGVISDENEREMREHYLRAKINFLRGLIKRVQTFWLHSEFIYNMTNLHKIQANHARTLHALTNAVIEKRKTEMKNKQLNTEQTFKPFLDLLLNMERDGTLTTAEVKEEVDTFTFTGSDSISVTLQIALLNIGSYPNVQREVFEELKEVFHGSDRDVEKQDMVHLKYLEAVIRESLRLYPTVPLVGRTLDKDVKIKNYTLYSGKRCFISLYALNRHSSWGPDAEEFRPERWLDPANLPSCSSLASFGLGRRRCIGLNYAIMLLKLTLAHLLRRYHVSGDITMLEQTMNVVAYAVPKDYISIELRDKIGIGQ